MKIAITGKMCSGKTTLLQIAGLLDVPTSGEIEINGIKVKSDEDKIRTKIRKENIGFIYQFHHLLPEFSAIENVALPLLIQGKSKKESKLKRLSLDLLLRKTTTKLRLEK